MEYKVKIDVGIMAQGIEQVAKQIQQINELTKRMQRRTINLNVRVNESAITKLKEISQYASKLASKSVTVNVKLNTNITNNTIERLNKFYDVMRKFKDATSINIRLNTPSDARIENINKLITSLKSLSHLRKKKYEFEVMVKTNVTAALVRNLERFVQIMQGLKTMTTSVRRTVNISFKQQAKSQTMGSSAQSMAPPTREVLSEFFHGLSRGYYITKSVLTGIYKFVTFPINIAKAGMNFIKIIDMFVSKVSQAVHYVSYSLGTIGRAFFFTSMTVATALAGLTKQFIDTYSEIERTGTKATYVFDTTTTKLDLFGEIMKSVGDIAERTGYNLSETAELLQYIGASGVSSLSDAKKLAEETISVALFTGAQPLDLYRSTLSIMNAYGQTMNEYTNTLAKLSVAAKASPFEINELITQLPRVTAFAEEISVSLDELLGSMVTLSKAGFMPSLIGTTLSQIYADIIKKRPQFLGLGIEVTEYKNGEFTFRPLTAILHDLVKRAGGVQYVPLLLQSLGLQKRSMLALITLVNNLDKLQANIEQVGSATVDELNSMNDVLKNSIWYQVERLKTAVMNLVATFGTTFKDDIINAITRVTDFIEKLTQKFNDEKFVRAIKEVAAILLKLLELGIILGFIMILMSLLTRFVAGILELLRPLNLLFAGLIYGLYQAFKNNIGANGEFEKKMGQATGTVGNSQFSLSDVIKVISDYAKFVFGIGETFGKTIGSSVGSSLSVIKSENVSTAVKFTVVVSDVIAAISEQIANMAEEMRKFVEALPSLQKSLKFDVKPEEFEKQLNNLKLSDNQKAAAKLVYNLYRIIRAAIETAINTVLTIGFLLEKLPLTVKNVDLGTADTFAKLVAGAASALLNVKTPALALLALEIGKLAVNVKEYSKTGHPIDMIKIVQDLLGILALGAAITGQPGAIIVTSTIYVLFTVVAKIITDQLQQQIEEARQNIQKAGETFAKMNLVDVVTDLKGNKYAKAFSVTDIANIANAMYNMKVNESGKFYSIISKELTTANMEAIFGPFTTSGKKYIEALSSAGSREWFEKDKKTNKSLAETFATQVQQSMSTQIGKMFTGSKEFQKVVDESVLLLRAVGMQIMNKTGEPILAAGEIARILNSMLTSIDSAIKTLQTSKDSSAQQKIEKLRQLAEQIILGLYSSLDLSPAGIVGLSIPQSAKYTGGYVYAGGGYTGSGTTQEPAGVVHKGEYVVPQWMVRQHPELVAQLEQIRQRGYAAGGIVDYGKGLLTKFLKTYGRSDFRNALSSVSNTLVDDIVKSAAGSFGNDVFGKMAKAFLSGVGGMIKNVLGLTIIQDLANGWTNIVKQLPSSKYIDIEKGLIKPTAYALGVGIEKPENSGEILKRLGSEFIWTAAEASTHWLVDIVSGFLKNTLGTTNEDDLRKIYEQRGFLTTLIEGFRRYLNSSWKSLFDIFSSEGTDNIRKRGSLYEFATGGYTGGGTTQEIAGVVHKGEYVIPQWMVRKYPELIAQLENRRLKGFYSGGNDKLGTVGVTDLDKPKNTLSILTDQFSNINTLFESFTLIFEKISELINQIVGNFGQLSEDLKTLSKTVSEAWKASEGATPQGAKPVEPTGSPTTPTGKKEDEFTSPIGKMLSVAIQQAMLYGDEKVRNEVPIIKQFGTAFDKFWTNIEASAQKTTGRTKYDDLATGIDTVTNVVYNSINAFGGFLDLLKNSQGAGDFLNKLVDWSKEQAKPLVGLLEKSDLTKPVATGLGNIIAGAGDTIKNIKNSEAFKFVEPMLDPIISILGGVVGSLGQVVMSFTAVQKALSPVNTAIEAFVEVLTPIVNEVFAPLIGVWRILGDLLAKMFIPILKMLQPFIMLIAQLLIAGINILLPAFKFVYEIFRVLANVAIDVYNIIADIVNALLGVFGVRMGKLEKVASSDEMFGNYSLEQAMWKGSNAISGGGSSGGTTSTAQNISYTVTVYVNFNDAVIADKEELANIIREQLERQLFETGKVG